KWQKLYDPDGLGRLLREGAWYQNCHYPYAYTLTAAGHASLVAGCPPSRHGVIANDWYDRATGSEVGAVQTLQYRTVPLLTDPKAKDEGPGPVRLKRPTVADMLQKAKQGKAKVVSLSIKDRAAVFLGALREAAVYWFDTLRGLFVTSTYYRDAPHPWVSEFNKGRPADKAFGRDWVRLRPDLDYAKYSGPDGVAAEGTGYDQ